MELDGPKTRYRLRDMIYYKNNLLVLLSNNEYIKFDLNDLKWKNVKS